MEDFKLHSPHNKYYDYALIDPRDKSIFYIAKYSGNRHIRHLQTNYQHQTIRLHC